MRVNAVAAGFVSFVFAVVAQADTFTVGSGANVAHSVINFGDGAVYTFDVFFDGSTTGIGLFDVIEANTSLVTARQVFAFGTFIDGISFDGHSDIGYAGGENWWHYWTKDSGQSTWTAAGFGPSDRVVHNGDSDGWVYGRATEPVPEPVSIMLLAAGAVLLGRQNRMSRAS